MAIDQRHKITKKVTLVGVAVNAILSLAQIICGFLGHSQALVADGIHTLSDLSSDFVVLYATKRASEAPDAEHPYGHGRIETLASLLLGIMLIGVGLSLGIRGIWSISDSTQTGPDLITLPFAALAIVSKEFLYRYTIKAARQIHSTLLESNAMHHRSDVLSSIVVVIGIGCQLMGIAYMDALAAIIVSVMVSLMGCRLARKSLDELIDSSLDQTLVANIRQLIGNRPDVKAIHQLRTRSMGGQGYVDAELRVNPRLTVSEAHYIAYSLEQQIKHDYPRIIDVSIHIDPLDESGHEGVNHLPSRDELLKQLDECWSAISFRHQIDQYNLHYLDERIDIELLLPASLNSKDHDADIELLVQSAEDIDHIGAVSVSFHR